MAMAGSYKAVRLYKQVSVLLNLSIMATANQTLFNFRILVVELRSSFNGGKKKRIYGSDLDLSGSDPWLISASTDPSGHSEGPSMADFKKNVPNRPSVNIDDESLPLYSPPN
ncbi:hypothetical protein U1Q18_021142 [Sarracenia purpurea var. burkii]